MADKQADRNFIMAAAELLKTDIRSVVEEKGTYPTSLEMSLVMKTLLYVPESLKLFLHTLSIDYTKRSTPTTSTWSRGTNASPLHIKFSSCINLGLVVHIQRYTSTNEVLQ